MDETVPQSYSPEFRDLQMAIFRDVQNGGEPLYASETHVNEDLYQDLVAADTQVGSRKPHTAEIDGTKYKVEVAAYNESLGLIPEGVRQNASVGRIDIQALEFTGKSGETHTGILYLDIMPWVNGKIHVVGEITDPSTNTQDYTQEEYDAALRFIKKLGIEQAVRVGQESHGAHYIEIAGFLEPEAMEKVTEFVTNLS